MFLGAMIIGPFSGWILKMFDKWTEGHIKAGFEMLVSNFSVGILGMLLAIVSYLAFAPVMEFFSAAMAAGVNFFVDHGILPLASLIEPAKILFLNNAINHGILTPLGLDQVAETGKSIFFLLESTSPGSASCSHTVSQERAPLKIRLPARSSSNSSAVFTKFTSPTYR